jgi:mannan endo-1,4-beta-mannosidase
MIAGGGHRQVLCACVLLVSAGCDFGDHSSGSASSPQATSATNPTSASSPTEAGQPAAGSAARPAYNTGNGLFVLHGKLYDANGNEFRIRGVNRLHYDSDSAAGIARSGANTVRWNVDFTRPAGTNVAMVKSQSVRLHNIPIVGSWIATCKADPAALSSIVSSWVAQAAQWTTLDRYLIVNVANEWGPAASTVWRDSYISAIGSLRAAGYLGPILVDSGGCGQDDADLQQYSQAVFSSDPQKNVMFALHLYGGTNAYSASIKSVQKGNPTVVTLVGDSPTHPFAPNFNGSNNSWNGFSSYQVSGVQGMTQLNGLQPSLVNVGGGPGAWTVTLTIDSSNWGNYSGGGTLVDSNNYAVRIARLAALSASTGAVYIVGEFGPGQNIGPSPTLVTPAQIITTAEANQVGWLAWAWDDVDLQHCLADNHWFSMTYNCGTYTQPSDLTNYGQDVVLNPTYGISVLAKPASVF